MKLDPIFTVKSKKLYKISDGSEVNTSSLKKITIPWSTVEMEDEVYNEEFLANLRDSPPRKRLCKCSRNGTCPCPQR